MNPNGLVGIDVETIELRSEQFMKDWFTQNERQLAGNDSMKQTLIWSMKESLSKLLGTGFSIHPKLFEITSIQHELCSVQFHKGAFATWQSINITGSLKCYWQQTDKHIHTIALVSTKIAQSIC